MNNSKGDKGDDNGDGSDPSANHSLGVGGDQQPNNPSDQYLQRLLASRSESMNSAGSEQRVHANAMNSVNESAQRKRRRVAAVEQQVAPEPNNNMTVVAGKFKGKVCFTSGSAELTLSTHSSY